MNLIEILLYFFIALAVAAVIGILITKNIFKAALFLLICLLCVAAVYVLFAADFVAVVQILIYAGGVVVVLIFGIMLTTKIAGKPLVITNGNIFSGSLLAFSLFALLVNILSQNLPLNKTQHFPASNLEQFGMSLMTTHALAFETSGVLLLVALVGAAVTTSFMKSKNT